MTGKAPTPAGGLDELDLAGVEVVCPTHDLQHAASAATGPAAATATPDRTSRRRVTPDVISSSLLGADETDPMRAGAAQRPGALKGRPGALPDYAGVSLARLVRSRPSRWVSPDRSDRRNRRQPCTGRPGCSCRCCRW